ncbi:MAG: replicative DNA helicase [Planctomycetota bacterium]|jgi:replicative DNA helicase
MARKRDRDKMNLPADKGAEENLLNWMISKPVEIGKAIDRITEDDFFYPAHKTIYQTILTLYAELTVGEKGEIDKSAVWDEIRKMEKEADGETGADDADVSLSYLQYIAGLTPLVPNIDYYIDLVLECSKDRRLLLLSKDIKNIASEAGESEEKMERVRQKVQQLTTPEADMKVVSVGDSLAEHARTLQEGSPGCVKSGFVELDRHIGGFYPGDLAVIAARPSMGKTSLALNIALNAAMAGTGVLFISLEMTVPQLRNRALCMLAGLSFSEVRHNPELGRAKKKTLLDAAKKYEKQSPPLYITNAGHTPEEQATLIRQYRQINDIGLIVIDYFQLMITDHRQENLRHMATELSRAVKRLAQTENLPVILTSQLGPEHEDRKIIYPRLTDLREFGSVDQDADLIMLLFREDYYRRKDESYGAIEAFEIDIAKHRNGPTGHVKLMFDKEKMMFSDSMGVL